MNNKVVVGSIVIVGMLSVVAIAIAIFALKEKPKVGYVELNILYDEFELKKELEGKLANVQNARQLVLDSLKLQLQTSASLLQGKLNPTKEEISRWQSIKSNYQETEKRFSEDNYSLTESYNQQIWKQLNQYIEDFGKENNYEFIYGAEGSGALMYGSSKHDITNTLIKYCDDKYKGL